MQPRMVLAYRAPTGIEAHVVRAAFEQHEIPAEVRNEMLAPLAGGLPLADVMVEVWIPSTHVDAAKEVLDTLRRPHEGAGQLSIAAKEGPEGALSEPTLGELSPAEATSERACPSCGEMVPRELSECWNCQSAVA